MSGTDWRNVRIKEEPMSDFEDGRGGSRSRSYDHPVRGGGGDRGDRRAGESRRDRRDSPPPTHGRSSNKYSRSRSRSPPNYREREIDNNRDRSRNATVSKRERSRSRERMREPPIPPFQDDRGRRRPSSRERERERPRPDVRRVKTEPRSRSPSPNRSQARDRGEPPSRDNRGDRDPGQSQNSRERPRDGARERDWNNFFDPKSDMSKQAFAKREKEEQERKTSVEEFGKKDDNEEEAPKEKEQPNFGLSGKLTEETNTFRGVVIKYSEPPEARKPNKIRWRLYPFKGEEALPVMHIHRQSAYLLGRERKIADIPVDHPSCSKQHAVLQYRLVPYVRADGSKGRRIKPYILDLESANGTYVNGKQIDPKRYVELFEKDVLKFGYSSREYVLLHDESKGIEDDASEMTPD